jgi:Ger(x)C family germination protein
MLKRVGLSALLCLCLVMGGCWDANDIEDMTIPTAASYDIDHTGGQSTLRRYLITTLNPNLIPDAPKKYRIEAISGQTIGEIRSNRHFQSPRPYVVGMIQVNVFSKEVAGLGLRSTTDILYRSPAISNALMLAVATGRGDEIIKTRSENYQDVGYLLIDLLHNAKKNNFMVSTTLHELARCIFTPGRNPVMPALQTDGKNIIHAGTAIFKRDRLIDIIDEHETRSLVLLRGIEAHGYIKYVLEREGNVADVGTIFAKNSRKVEVTRQGDQFTFNIKILLQGPLVERFTNQPLLADPQALTEIENQIATDIRQEAEAFIEKMQNDYQIDCIDISKYALAHWRQELTPVIDKDFIDKADIKVQVKVKIINTGDLD